MRAIYGFFEQQISKFPTDRHIPFWELRWRKRRYPINKRSLREHDFARLGTKWAFSDNDNINRLTAFLLIHWLLDGSVWKLMIALFDSFWYSFLFVGWFSLFFFFQGGVFFLTIFGWHLRNVDIHLCIFYFLFLSLHFFTPFTFLPLFYGCMEEVLVFFGFLCFFFSSGMEMEWKEKGVEWRRRRRILVGLDFVGGYYFFFFSFLSFYVLLFLLTFVLGTLSVFFHSHFLTFVLSCIPFLFFYFLTIFSSSLHILPFAYLLKPYLRMIIV